MPQPIPGTIILAAPKIDAKVADSKSAMPADPTSLEYQYAQSAFSMDTTLQLKKSTLQLIQQHIRINIFTYLTDNAFSLGLFVNNFIKRTHLMMKFIALPKLRDKLLLQRVKLLIELLKIIFYDCRQRSMAENFTEKWEKNIFVTILISFNNKEADNWYLNAYLWQGYAQEVSILAFKEGLERDYNDFETALTTAIGSVNINPETALRRAKKFYSTVVEQYTKTSVPKFGLQNHIRIGGIIAGCGAFVGYFFGLELLGATIGSGYYAYRSRYLPYRPTISLQEQQDLEKYVTAVFIHEIDQRTKDLQSNLDEKSEIKVTTVELPIYQIAYSNSDTQIPEQYITAAFETYKKTKKVKLSTTSGTDNIEKTEDTLIDQKTSYTRIIPQLDATLQARGILVIDENASSKGFFEFGNYQDITMGNLPKIRHGILQNGFIAAKGAFGGFKYMPNLKHYELKLANGMRIEYAKSKETVDISGESVPCWQPLSYTRK